jgi:hypothetical protein
LRLDKEKKRVQESFYDRFIDKVNEPTFEYIVAHRMQVRAGNAPHHFSSCGTQTWISAIDKRLLEEHDVSTCMINFLCRVLIQSFQDPPSLETAKAS